MSPLMKTIQSNYPSDGFFLGDPLLPSPPSSLDLRSICLSERSETVPSPLYAPSSDGAHVEALSTFHNDLARDSILECLDCRRRDRNEM